MQDAPLPPLTAIPPDIASVADYARYARERITASAWEYIEGGAADEITLADNLAAFRRVGLRQSVLADLSGARTDVEILGQRFDYPIMLAPVAWHKLAHPDGELATVLGASAMRAGMVLSTQSSTELTAVAAASQTTLWFQLYLQADRDFTLHLVRKAEESGYRAIVLTADAPVNGIRNREQRARFALPGGVESVNLRGMQTPAHVAQAGVNTLFGSQLLQHAPGWKDLEWLAGHSRLPVLVKGIGTAEDALRALDHGAAGLIVSNHGGRTLDTLPATLDVLPEIAAAVQQRAPILLDGGIRRGSDVFKAIALGATSTLIGRPYIHALAAAGATGVAHVLHLLRSELEVTMALAGRATLADIDASALRLASGTRR